MSEKYKKTRKYLDCVEHLLILASTITSCVSIFAFASLVCVPICITSSTVGTKTCAITGRFKKYKSVVKKKKKRHDKMVLLENGKLNTNEVLISKALIDLHISHDKFFSINSVLRENNKTKK